MHRTGAIQICPNLKLLGQFLDNIYVDISDKFMSPAWRHIAVTLALERALVSSQSEISLLYAVSLRPAGPTQQSLVLNKTV